LFSIFFFQSCKSTKLAKEDLCNTIDKTMIELASNMSKYNDSNCYKFTFDKDSIKYSQFVSDYKKRHNIEFLDDRFYEYVYYLAHLTSKYEVYSEINQNCISSFNKNDIVKIFGTPTSINIYKNFYNYIIFTSKICEDCLDNGIENQLEVTEFCANYVRFYFDESNLKSMQISMRGL